jgi:AraC-like DNA-binding protein/quercetin dioxygenase-like cupin family protein
MMRMPPRHDPVSLGSPRFSTVEHGPFLVTSAFFPARLGLPPHTHERTVLAITMKGRWTSTLGRRNCESVMGHLLTEPAGDTHSNVFADGGARVLIVQPDPAADELLRPCQALLSTVNHRPSRAAYLTAERLSRELRRADDLSPLAVQSLCLELLSTAARDVASIPGDRPRWLGRVVEFLRAHFRERPRLETLAAISGAHPAQLSRAFRASFGTSPAEFVRNLRLDWVASELRETGDPIAEIAARAGFADQSHLTRLFRVGMGSTPARYRSAFRSRE